MTVATTADHVAEFAFFIYVANLIPRFVLLALLGRKRIQLTATHQHVLAILFDFDGLIVDTENLYRQAWSRILREGSEWAFDELASGRREEEAVVLLRDHLLPEYADPAAALHAKRNHFQRLSSDRSSLHLLPGIVPLIEALRGVYRLHVVSNSDADTVQRYLELLDLASAFEGLTCWSQSTPAKPAPDLYLRAMRELALGTDQVIALEDSTSGLVAARAAKVPVVCVSDRPIVAEYCVLHRIRHLWDATELVGVSPDNWLNASTTLS